MRRLTVVQLLPALHAGGVERSTLEIAGALVSHPVDGENDADEQDQCGARLLDERAVELRLHEAADGGQQRLADGLFLTSQRALPRGGESRRRLRAQLVQPAVEVLSDLVAEIVFVHKVIPFAFRATASACVAREQWVLTLPSEQPIAAAVSATSMSSQ